ncbi:LacI family DNA-binding transcriptional regulator [Paraburkholderia caribensis]|nr:LacI family DNA-binding transcriptional regulator [Paraburkholderia phymatum]MCO4881980.1 LacI family DNA-binding transcriptional regulator [Paraburkholderia caribensis]
MKVIELMDYEPDPVARGLSSGRFDVVAIVMTDITNPWYPPVLDLITRELRKLGLQALLFNASAPETVDDVMPLVLQYRVRGVIITTASLQSSGADLCVKRGVPVVMFNRYSQVGAGHSVSTDNVGGGRIAADCLLASGSRKPAFIGGNPAVSTNRDRRSGFFSRLAERDMLAPPSLDKEYTYAWGYEAAQLLLARHPDIDAFCCADDEIAAGAIDGIRFGLGLRVPEDVRIFGFDDHPVARQAAYEITTIRQPVAQMIAAALELLTKEGSSDERRLIPGELVIRSSTPSNTG